MEVNVTEKQTFPGGTHLPEKKVLTCDSLIQPGPAVSEVAVMLSQHIGAVCRPLVKKADTVQAGQKIGDCDAFVSAPRAEPWGRHFLESMALGLPTIGTGGAGTSTSCSPATASS